MPNFYRNSLIKDPNEAPDGVTNQVSELDNASLAQLAPGLGLPATESTSIPLMAGLSNNELAVEQAQPKELLAPVMEPSAPSILRSPAAVKPIAPAMDDADQTEEKPAESNIERLERLMSEMNNSRKKELEDASSRQMKANMLKAVTDNIGLIVGGAQAVNTKNSVTPVQTKGFDVGDLGAAVERKYKPEQEALLQQYKSLKDANSPLTEYQKAMLQGNAEQRAIARQALSIKANQLLEKPQKLTVGQEAADRDFGKTYNEWTTSGRPTVDKNLEKLNAAITKLEAQKSDMFGPTGKIVGSMPDLLRSENSISLRDDVQSAASAALKATLGPAFTEKEGNRIMAQAYNEKLSPEENIKKIKSAIKELEANKIANEAKTRHFEENGTLAGHKLSVPEDGDKPSTVERKTKNGKIAIFDAATKQFIKFKD